MINETLKTLKEKMQKSVEALHSELGKLRTGRAHPSLLEHVTVSYYGTDTPLNQVANITVENARTLNVTPWEKNMVAPIEKAIITSDLGLNPASAGQVIRVPLPPLTEERRRELVKVVKEEGEKARVSIRNLRREANTKVKELLKKKEITEDEERKTQQEIQKLTDDFVKEVDKIIEKKETDMMSV